MRAQSSNGAKNLQSPQVRWLTGPIYEDEWKSHDTEVAMLQRVFAAYQQITRSINKPAAARRSASLSVMALEERATPAVAIMPPPLQPQPVLIIAIPTAPTAAPVVASTEAVRSDLFGVGDAGTANQPDDLEAMLASDAAAKQTVVDAPAVQASATDAGDEGDGGAVIVENMVFLPRVE